MALCSNCSNPILATDGRCKACGAKTEGRARSQSNEAQSRADLRSAESRFSKLLLAVPLVLFGAAFAFFGALIGTDIGFILLLIAMVYFGLAGGVVFAKHPGIQSFCVVFGLIAVFIGITVATMKAPW